MSHIIGCGPEIGEESSLPEITAVRAGLVSHRRSMKSGYISRCSRIQCGYNASPKTAARLRQSQAFFRMTEDMRSI